MFADVGLGTTEREALLVHAEALLHVGRGDFVLVRSEQSPWRVQEVEVGEDHGDLVELLQGVAAGQEVVAGGAVLLKPVVVQALEQ
jgi:hypothetical protein